LRVMPYSNLMTGVAPFDVRVTLIDAANPFVFIDATTMPVLPTSLPDVAVHAIIESIRCEGAVAMGLASSVEAASKTRGTPKVALLYPPPISQGGSDQASIRVQSYSMGLPHPSFQLTGAVCLATALNYKGTVASKLSENSLNEVAPLSSTTLHKGARKTSAMEKKFAIAHSKGVIEVFTTVDSNGEVQGCAVSRTARKLFEGNVSYYI
jgi:2-methylaconitate cis-trans-isomerase PrpF